MFVQVLSKCSVKIFYKSSYRFNQKVLSFIHYMWHTRATLPFKKLTYLSSLTKSNSDYEHCSINI